MTAVTFPPRPPHLAFAIFAGKDGKMMSMKIKYTVHS